MRIIWVRIGISSLWRLRGGLVLIRRLCPVWGRWWLLLKLLRVMRRLIVTASGSYILMLSWWGWGWAPDHWDICNLLRRRRLLLIAFTLYPSLTRGWQGRVWIITIVRWRIRIRISRVGIGRVRVKNRR